MNNLQDETQQSTKTNNKESSQPTDKEKVDSEETNEEGNVVDTQKKTIHLIHNRKK